jgi:NAD-dependent histone deacetylase SIR2
MESLKIDKEKVTDVKYQILIEMLKAGKFNKISFMTGAGISTTAGIPDFRSSGSGLFKTLQQKYKLSKPEEFFEIGTFKSKPELFYEFAKGFDIDKYKPTTTHVIYKFYLSGL